MKSVKTAWKKFLVCVLALAMVVTAIPAADAMAFTSAATDGTANILTINGTPTDHGYKIDSVEGFKKFAELVNAGASFDGLIVSLACDIDLNEGIKLVDENNELKSDVDLSKVYEFPGIGAGDNAFAGTFDGNGHVISGLYMTSANSANAGADGTGLFTKIKSATIKNLGVVNAYVKIDSGYGAILVGSTGYGTASIKEACGGEDTPVIENCFVIGQLDAEASSSQYVGGLAGFYGCSSSTKGVITGCMANALVKSAGSKRIGMIVGQNYATIDNCFVTGGKIVAPNAGEDCNALQGRPGTFGENPNYVATGILDASCKADVIAAAETSNEKYIVTTADDVKAHITNKAFLANLDGSFVVGKGIPQADGTYSYDYSELIEKVIYSFNFDEMPNTSLNAPDDAGYFGSDSYPAFKNFRLEKDPEDPTNSVLAMTANTERCQLLLEFGCAEIPKQSKLSFRFYAPVGSAVASGVDWNGIVDDALQEVERETPSAKFDQALYIKAASDSGSLCYNENINDCQGKWIKVETSLGDFTDGNVIINFWKSIYTEAALAKAGITNLDLYIDDFKISGMVDPNAKVEKPDEKLDEILCPGAIDNGYDYTWTVSKDGMKGLPAICTDGTKTNVTPELFEALEKAKNTKNFFKPAKNFIVMIGDGMGINPVEASEHWVGELIMNNLPNQAASMTKSYTSTFALPGDGTEEGDAVGTGVFTTDVKISKSLTVTDSSAGGTAIAAGYKTYYYSMGINIDGTELRSTMDIAKDQKKALGDVTNGWIADATPFVFVGHVIKRGFSSAKKYNQKHLGAQEVEYGLDVFIGQGDNEGGYMTEVFDNAYGSAEIIKKKDIGIAYSWQDFLKLKNDKVVYSTACAFGYDKDVDATKESGLKGDKLAEYQKNLASQEQAFAYTLSKLQKKGGKNGFFVMFEDGEIDMDGHSNERIDQLQEVQNFDECIAMAIKFVLENPDTVLLITADHDTGGMQMKEGWDEYLKKLTYTTTGHSANNVPVYAIGYGTEVINGQVYQNNNTGRIIGNLMGETGFGDAENDPLVILDGGKYGANRVAALVDSGKAIGISANPLDTNNVLTTAEKEAAVADQTTVKFVPSTMTTLNSAVVKPGDKLTKPADPISNNKNAKFIGWFKDKACKKAWNFSKDTVSASGDTVLYAGWKVTAPAKPSIKNGKAYNKNGKLVKKAFVTVNGKQYYANAKGKVVKNAFVTVKGKKYYANKNGVIVKKAIVTVKGKKYYATKTGAILKNKKVTVKKVTYKADKNGVLKKVK